MKKHQVKKTHDSKKPASLKVEHSSKSEFAGFSGNPDPLFTNRLRMVDAVLGCIKYDVYVPWNGKYNRNINESSVKSISASIKQHGFIGTVMMVRTRAFSRSNEWELRTLDGQHRISAAEMAQSPFNYITVQFQDDTDDTKENVTNLIGNLNTTSRGWGYVDFMNAYVSLGKRFYVMLSKLINESKKEHGTEAGIKLIDMMHICSDGLANESVEKTFKKGLMQFRTDWETRYDVIDTLVGRGLPTAATLRRHVVRFMNLLIEEGYRHFALSMIKAMKDEGNMFLSSNDEKTLDGDIQRYFEKYVKNYERFYKK